MNKNKKGFTHLEMITAIILFVFAAFSIILLFNNYSKSHEISYSTLDFFEKNFLDKAGNFTKVDVFVSPSSSPCFKIPLNPNLYNLPSNIIIFGNREAAFSKDSNYFFIEDTDVNLYEIYSCSFSTLSTGLTLSINDCEEVSYNYSLHLKDKIFSYAQLQAINDSYYNGSYNDLKKSFDFAGDFSMKISNDTTTLFEMTRQKPLRAEVLAKNFEIKIFKDKKIITAVVNLQAWQE